MRFFDLPSGCFIIGFIETLDKGIVNGVVMEIAPVHVQTIICVVVFAVKARDIPKDVPYHPKKLPCFKVSHRWVLFWRQRERPK
jgi:hypothetical protein